MEEPSIHYHDPLLSELKELEERRQSIVDQRESVEVMISEVQEEIEDEKPWFYDLKNFLEGESFPEFATS